MNKQVLIIEVKGNAGILSFNRPERRNALSPELLVEIHLTLEKWAKQGDVRVVVLRGHEDQAFSSGYDILAIPTNPSPEMEEILRNNNPLSLAMDSVKNFPFPTIAMIKGYAFGAGLNMAICCDIRIGAESIKLGMPPAKLGLIYHAEGIKQFVDAIGSSAARELFFTAKTYRVPEVNDLGVLHHIVADDKIEEYTYEMAEKISLNAPLSLKGTKVILNKLVNTVKFSETDLDEIQKLIDDSFSSEDIKEGQLAFIEKRKPVFAGK